MSLIPPGEPFRRDDIAAAIRADIIRGDIPPGTRLGERDLSKRFHVSRVPVREALFLLEAQRLVEMKPRRGAFVRELTANDVIELFDVREALEPLAAKLSARNRTEAELEQLREAFSRATAARDAQDGDAGADANTDFHLILLNSGHSELLVSIMAPLHAHIQRLFRRTIVGFENPLVHDHESMLHAIEDQDEARAERIARAHLRSTRERSILLFDA